MLAGFWYSANWGLVLVGLIAGVAASVLGRRLSPVRFGASISVIGLYLWVCAMILLAAIQLGQGVVVAGLQVAVGLATLGVSICRLHLVGVAIHAAGSSALALIRGISDDPALFQDSTLLVLNVAAAGFLLTLWRFVVAEWRQVTSARDSIQAWPHPADPATGAQQHHHIEKSPAE